MKKKMDMLYLAGERKVKSLLQKMTGKVMGASLFVEVVVVIIIILALAVFFRDAIIAWFTNLFAQFQAASDALF